MKKKLANDDSEIQPVVPNNRHKRGRGMKQLLKLLQDEDFKTEQRVIKGKLATGSMLDEARWEAGVTDGKRWDLHILALGVTTWTPESIMLHYHQRTKARYGQLFDLLRRAQCMDVAPNGKLVPMMDKHGREIKQTSEDRNMEHRIIITLAKLDASEATLAQALGLVKPAMLEVGDVGRSNQGDVEKQIEIINAEIDERIKDVRAALPPVTIDILAEPVPGGSQDPVEPTPVHQDAAGGSIAVDSVPQGVPDGGVDTVFDMDAMALQNPPSP